MATIVTDSRNNKKYILIGTGYGMHKSLTEDASDFFSFYKRKNRDRRTICVSDEKGEIFWLLSRDIVVHSVDGVKPSELLDARNF